MNRGRVSTRFLLFFLMLMFLMVTVGTGCSKSDDAIIPAPPAAAATYSISDLVGTWRVQGLIGGSANGWMRAIVTIDSDGSLTFDSCTDSASGTYCSDYVSVTLVWSIDTETGEISETADGNPSENHYTLASNKKLLSGSQHKAGTSHPAILVAQKTVPGTSYADSDLYNKSLVYHKLSDGVNITWEYGGGTINGTGVVSPGNYTDPTGTHASGSGPGTLSVSPAGVVTMSDDMGFIGFLSDDKKTIVGTETDGGTTYQMMILQITDGQSSSTSGALGTWYGHMLTVGTGTDVPFWAHQSMDITSAGVMTFEDWVASSAATGPDSGTTYTLLVGGSGTATITQSVGTTDFHGQVSYDGTFMVGTQTFGTGAYTLMVITKASSTIIPDIE